MNALQKKLIANGVKNLKSYGYPHVTSNNILTDRIYSAFFGSMLRDNKGQSVAIDQAIDGILKSIGPQ